MSESTGNGLESLNNTQSTAEESQKFIDEQAQLIEELRNETDSIQRVTQASFIKNRITTFFDPFLKRKDLTLEEIESERAEVQAQAKMLDDIITEIGEVDSSKMNGDDLQSFRDVENRLIDIHSLISSYDKKLANKADRIEKKIAKEPEEPQIQPKQKVTAARPAKLDPNAEEVDVTPVVDTEKSQEQDVSVPLMITKGMKQALADLGYGKAARSSMKPDEAHEIIKEQRTFIKEKAEEKTQEVPKPEESKVNTKADMGLEFPDGQVAPAADSTKKKAKPASPKVEKEKTIEKHAIKGLEELTSFIEDPASLEITNENYEETFKQIVAILENASKDVKSLGDKDAIESLKNSTKTLWDKTVENVKPGVIKNGIKRELLQELCTEFADLDKALFIELKKIKRAEAEKPKEPMKTAEQPAIAKVKDFEGLVHFLDVDLENLEINQGNSNEILNDIKSAFNAKFKFVKGCGKAEMADFKNEMFEIEENFNAKFENETNKAKLILIKKIHAHIARVFQEIDITLGNIKREPIESSEPVQEATKVEEKKTQETPAPVAAKEVVDNQPGKIKSLGGINNFISKVLPTMADDVQELKKKGDEITRVLQKQYELLDENDAEGLLKARSMTNKMTIELGDMNLTGGKDTFGDTLLESLAQFSMALDRKSKKEKIEDKKDETETKNSSAPIPNIDTASTSEPEAQPEKARSIEDIIDHGDENSPAQIPEAIKKDEGFNSWIDRVYKKGYDESAKTLEEWHTLYEAQKPKIKLIEEIYKNAKIGDEVFKNFATKSDKEFAYKKQIEALEYSLLTDPNGESKVNTIISSFEKTKEQEEKIKSLEEEKDKLSAGYSSKQYKLPQELVLRAVHGEDYEIQNLNSMDEFIVDMKKNYNHYKSTLQGNEADDVKLANMFGLYSKTSAENRKTGLNLFKKVAAKIRNAFDATPHDYDDKTEFKGKFKALREAGIFESNTVNKELAEENMRRLVEYTHHIKEWVTAGKISVEKALSLADDEPAKALFMKVFPQYLKAVAENDRTQSKAKDSGVKSEMFKTIDQKIQDAQTEGVRLQKDTIRASEGDMWERNEFNIMVRKELLGETMDSIVKTLGQKSLDAKTLAKLQEEFASITEEDADELQYKRVSLQLAQAEVSFMAKAKEVSLAPNSIKKYEAIFQDRELTQEKKMEYAESILKLLDEKLKKQKLNTVEQLEIKRFIRYFENQKAIFKK